MEVTLEKIELVRDRTGVSYKEAKDALEAADGSVVDAIISIEESMDGGVTRTTSEKKDEILAKMKDIVNKGGISKIRITRNDDVIMNIPLVAGILGTVIAPWGAIIGTLAAFGFKCKIEFVKEDGSIVDLSEKAVDVYDNAKERGTEFVADVKEKAPGLYAELKDKAPGSLDELKNKAQDTFNELKDKAPDSFDELMAKGEEALNKAKDMAKDASDRFRKEVEDIEIDVDLTDEAGEDLEDLEAMQKAAAEGIKDFEEEVKKEQ